MTALGGRYLTMRERGELATYPGRVTPAGEFLQDCAARLQGSKIAAAGADRYRRAEVEQALSDASLYWPMHWRGTGASKTADGSHDVRSFQRSVLSRGFKWRDSLLMASAIKESSIRFDPAGNPALDKSRVLARIDCLQAGVIAAGLGAIESARPARGWRSLGVA